MSEFKIHHHVSEIMDLLGAHGPEAVGAEVYSEMLLKNRTPYITTQVSAHQAKRKIAQSSKTPREFLEQYEELKSKNVHDLDPMVYMLSRLTDESETRKFLEKNAKEREQKSGVQSAKSVQKVVSQLPAPGTKMTGQEFALLKDQLMKASATTTVTSSEALRKILRDKHQKRNVNIPHQPDWLFDRPSLTMDFVRDTSSPDKNVVSVGTLPLALQEQAIIEDVLCCMQGVEGKYIIPKTLTERYASKQFTIDLNLDASLRELTSRILPMCADYSTVVRFVEEKSAFEYGLVNHALSAAMRNLIKDYMVLVAQLEHQFRLGSLLLQKMWFYLQPTMRTLTLLASVANSVNRGECIGGAVLSLLHEKTSNLIGDVKGQELALYLTQAACTPYFEILEKWIYKGIVCDPYSEFLVEENETIIKEKLEKEYNDAYWDEHYTICRERIPVFLEHVADKILNTGKYLNVIRLCGRDVRCPAAEEIIYSIKERNCFEQIEKAYDYSSKLLLSLLMEEKQLMARIKSIKHYFLLAKGDFIVQFMDMTEDEMKKDMDDILSTRLESLLELALRTSTANEDPFKDDLKVDLLRYDLITQLFKILTIDTKLEKDYRVDRTDIHLSGLESFSFDYIVKWPISLVINRKSLTSYQLLFRHLFYSKYVERQLCSVWIVNKSSKLYSITSSSWYTSSFALRQRMLNFVQNFQYYMMFEVIEPHWHNFFSNMDSATNIDDVLACHTDFLNNCLKDCMLTSPDLLKILHKLMMVCVTYCNFAQRLGESTNIEMEAKATRESTLQAAPTLKDRRQDPDKKKAAKKVLSDHASDLGASETYERTIMSFDKNFSRLLLELLDKIMDLSSESEHKLFNIIYRLDFNGFYTPRLEAMAAQRTMSDSSTVSSQGSDSGLSAPAPPSLTNKRPETATYVPGVRRGSGGNKK